MESMNYETNMYSGEEIKTLPELKTNERLSKLNKLQYFSR